MYGDTARDSILREIEAARPFCIYCGLKVDDGAFDGESHGWFSWHFMCMSSSQRGRYGVLCTSGFWNGELDPSRYDQASRAGQMADRLTRTNPGATWHVYDCVEGMQYTGPIALYNSETGERYPEETR